MTDNQCNQDNNFLLQVIIILTFPTSAGIFVELVLNPIPNTNASGLLTNLATNLSKSRTHSRVPTKT